MHSYHEFLRSAEFLDAVSGMSYLPESQFAVELDDQVQNLYRAHLAFDNFYNEPPQAKRLERYVPETGAIPDSVRPSYVKTLLLARIGNGYGVSRAAVSYYDSLINRFQEPEIKQVPLLIEDSEFASRLQFRVCADRYKEVCLRLRERTNNSYVQQALDKIIESTPEQVEKLRYDSKMKRLLKNIVDLA